MYLYMHSHWSVGEILACVSIVSFLMTSHKYTLSCYSYSAQTRVAHSLGGIGMAEFVFECTYVCCVCRVSTLQKWGIPRAESVISLLTSHLLRMKCLSLSLLTGEAVENRRYMYHIIHQWVSQWVKNGTTCSSIVDTVWFGSQGWPESRWNSYNLPGIRTAVPSSPLVIIVYTTSCAADRGRNGVNPA